MKKIILSIFLMLNTIISAQKFLNGNFENATENCNINMLNERFNASMSNCFAFGIGDQVDILDANCGYGSPQDGERYIALAVGGDEKSNDELSIELDAPLKPGTEYTLSFYFKKDGAHETNKLQFGYSNTKDKFGSLIATIKGAKSQKWVQVKLVFTPKIEAQYITVRAMPGYNGWNQLDNFSFLNQVPYVDPSGQDPR